MRQPATFLLVLMSLCSVTLAFVPPSSPVTLDLHLPPVRLEPGTPALLSVVAYSEDGAPAAGQAVTLEPVGQTAYTNSRGAAHFRFTSESPRAITYTISEAQNGEALERFEITWSEIHWTITPERTSVVAGNHHSLNATASWAWDSTPAPGMQVYAYKNGVTYLSAATDAAGQTTLDLLSDRAGTLTYQIWTQTNDTRTNLSLRWLQPPVQNTPPTLTNVTLEFDGRTAFASAGEIHDADGDQVSVLYSWYVNGSFTPGRTARLSVSPLAQVTVIATPFDGVSGGETRRATATAPANLPPHVSVRVEQATDGGYVLDARNSVDPERENLTYHWNLPGVPNATGQVVRLPAHTQQRNVGLLVTDPWGGRATWETVLPPASETNSSGATQNGAEQPQNETPPPNPTGGANGTAEREEPGTPADSTDGDARTGAQEQATNDTNQPDTQTNPTDDPAPLEQTSINQSAREQLEPPATSENAADDSTPRSEDEIPGPSLMTLLIGLTLLVMLFPPRPRR